MISDTPKLDPVIKALWDRAIELYKQTFGDNLELPEEWKAVSSVSEATSLLESTHSDFRDYREKNANIREYLDPLLDFVIAFSDVAKDALSTVWSPATVIFSAINILLKSAKGVSKKYDAIADTLKCTSAFFSRLQIYTRKGLQDGLLPIIIQLLVQVLALLRVTTIEIRVGRLVTLFKMLGNVKDAVKPILQDFNRLISEEQQMIAVLTYDNSRTENHHRIHNLLKFPYPTELHNKAIKHHENGTGLWICQVPQFREWEGSPGNFLWVHGLLGTGKTVLFSTIVKYLQQKHLKPENISTTTCGIAYFYCTLDDPLTLSTRSILGSFLKQLASQCLDVPQVLYDRLSRNNGEPDDLVWALQNMLTGFTRAYLLFDGLDQCSKCSKLGILKILSDVLEVTAGKLHLLIVSRPDRDLELSLVPKLRYNIDLTAYNDLICKDIVIYVQKALLRYPNVLLQQEAIRLNIEKKLTLRADSMFLWVRCVLDMVTSCTSEDTINRALDSLPHDLEKKYNQVLEHVGGQHRHDIQEILCWLAVARCPVTLNDISDTVMVDMSSGEPKVDPKCRPDAQMLLDNCPGLITVEHRDTPSSGIARLVHASIKDYVVSQSYFNLSSAPVDHSMLARAIAYTLATTVHQEASYVIKYWSDHLYAGGVEKLDSPLPMLLSHFLNGPVYGGGMDQHYYLLPTLLRDLRGRHVDTDKLNLASVPLRYLDVDGVKKLASRPLMSLSQFLSYVHGGSLYADELEKHDSPLSWLLKHFLEYSCDKDMSVHGLETADSPLPMLLRSFLESVPDRDIETEAKLLELAGYYIENCSGKLFCDRILVCLLHHGCLDNIPLKNVLSWAMNKSLPLLAECAVTRMLHPHHMNKTPMQVAMESLHWNGSQNKPHILLARAILTQPEWNSLSLDHAVHIKRVVLMKLLSEYEAKSEWNGYFDSSETHATGMDILRAFSGRMFPGLNIVAMESVQKKRERESKRYFGALVVLFGMSFGLRYVL